MPPIPGVTRLGLYFLFCIAGSPLLFGQVSGPVAQAEREVRDMERKWREAWLAADGVALDRIHAEDYTAIPNIGTVSTKAEIMADVRRGVFQYTRMEHSEMTVRIYGATGVVLGRTINEGNRGGRKVENN